MKVLLAHNFYRTPGGEDEVFKNESALLQENGHEVIRFTRSNDELDEGSLGNKLRIARNTIWSKESYKAIEKVILLEKPDIAHFHNTHPIISPSAYSACRKHGVPVVQTLHNYRLICPGALLQRDGHPCEICVGRTPLPGIRHKCYQNSMSASAVVTASLIWNRLQHRFSRDVDRYIALTAFAADRFSRGGIPTRLLRVKPNFLPRPPNPGTGDGNYVIYLGRLMPEKGLRTLLTAWNKLSDVHLKIIGGGPLEQELKKYADIHNLPVQFHGQISHEDVLKLLAKATALIVPSEWYEGFPMVVLEAFASGTPVLASKIGSLDEIIDEGVTGYKFQPGDPASISATVRNILERPECTNAMRRHARKTYEENYSPGINYKQLIQIYDEAIKEAGKS